MSFGVPLNPWIRVDVDEDGICTIIVKDDNLKDFPFFMRCVIKEKIGMEHGFFKIVFNEPVGQTTLQELTTYVQNYFKHKVFMPHPEGKKGKWDFPVVEEQQFFYGHYKENIYGYQSAKNTSAVIAKNRSYFINCLSDPELFMSTSSCCSQELSNSLDALQEHYWGIIRQISKKSSAMTLSEGNVDANQLLQDVISLRRNYYVDAASDADIKLDTMKQSHTSSNFDKTKILYASGIPTKNTKFPISPNFCLSELHTILDEYDKEVLGISSPFLYVGLPHSSFGYHTEDAALFSINYLHYGAPCLWFFVPPKHFKKFGEWTKFFSLDIGQVSCAHVLGSAHKYLMACKKILQKLGISCHTVVQKAQEIIVTYPFAPHSGFKFGWNFQEAANFADDFWIEPAILAPICECFPFVMQMDLTKLIAICRPKLLQMYIDRDLVNLTAALAENEFIKLLGLIPHAVSSNSDVSMVVGGQPTLESQTIDSSSKAFEHKQSEEETKVTSFQGSRCLLKCPVHECGKEYKGGRGRLTRLLHHVVKCHGGTDTISLLNQVHSNYPPKENKGKSMICRVCGEIKAGGNTDMKRHLARKHGGKLN